MRNEEQALAIWRRIGQKRGLALSLNEMGTVQAALGKRKDALASFQEALQDPQGHRRQTRPGRYADRLGEFL